MTALPIGQAARELGVHRDTIRSYLEKGHLDGFRLPTGRWRVYTASLDRLRRESRAEDAALDDLAREILASVHDKSHTRTPGLRIAR